jgi:hypothetical protein
VQEQVQEAGRVEVSVVAEAGFREEEPHEGEVVSIEEAHVVEAVAVKDDYSIYIRIV